MCNNGGTDVKNLHRAKYFCTFEFPISLENVVSYRINIACLLKWRKSSLLLALNPDTFQIKYFKLRKIPLSSGLKKLKIFVE